MANGLLNPKTAAWPATLAGATILGSLALACVFPFAAIAALAALTPGSNIGQAFDHLRDRNLTLIRNYRAELESPVQSPFPHA